MGLQETGLDQSLELCHSKVSFSQYMKILMNLEKELRRHARSSLFLRSKDSKFYLPCKTGLVNPSLDPRVEGKYQKLFNNKTQLPNNKQMNNFSITLHSLSNNFECWNLITQRLFKTTVGVKSSQFNFKSCVKSCPRTWKHAK